MRKYRITYALLLLVLGVLAGIMRDRYFVSMFLSVLILPLLSLVWLVLSVRGMEVTAHTIQQTPKKGVPVSITTTLRPAPGTLLPAVRLHLSPEIDGDAVVLLSSELSPTPPLETPYDGQETSLPKGMKRTRSQRKGALFLTTTLLFDCCGEYSLEAQHLKVTDLLHLFELRKPIPPDAGVTQSLLIYPNVYPLQEHLLFAREQDAERLYRSPSGIPDESNIIGYQVHQDYDDSRYIHWKLSARSEEYLSKQFYSATQSNLLMVLDFAPLNTEGPEHDICITLDCMLETTVSLIANYLERGQELILLYFQDTLHQECLSSMAQFEMFYQQSPYLGKHATFSLAQLLSMQGNTLSAQQENKSATIVTQSVDDAFVTQIERMMALGWTVLVVDCGFFPSDLPLQAHLATCPNLAYTTAAQLFLYPDERVLDEDIEVTEY